MGVPSPGPEFDVIISSLIFSAEKSFMASVEAVMRCYCPVIESNLPVVSIFNGTICCLG